MRLIFIFIIFPIFLYSQATEPCGDFCSGDGPQLFTTGFSTNIGTLTYTGDPLGTLVGQDLEVDMSSLTVGAYTVCVLAECPEYGCELEQCFSFNVTANEEASCDCFQLQSTGYELIPDCEAIVCEGDATRFGIGDGTFGQFPVTPSSVTWDTPNPGFLNSGIVPAGTATVTAEIEFPPESCLSPETKVFTITEKIITPNPVCPPTN